MGSSTNSYIYYYVLTGILYYWLFLSEKQYYIYLYIDVKLVSDVTF